MAAKSKKPAARGFVNNIILQSLVSGDKYGYEIIKEVEEKSNGDIVLKQPSLYSSLKRFETKGYITSYWGDSDIGGRRHYYSVTQEGLDYFETIKSELTVTFDDDNAEPAKPMVAQTPKPAQEKPVDFESDDYDVFELLNNDTVKNVDNDTEQTTAKPNENIEETKPVETETETETKPESADVSIEEVAPTTPQQTDTDDVQPKTIVEKVAEETDEQQPVQPKQTEEKPYVAPELSESAKQQEQTNWEKLRGIIANRTKQETATLNQEVQPKPELEEEEEKVEQATLADEVNATQQLEQPQEVTPQARELRVIVDEYGIMKSEYDSLPKKQAALFDNVGSRLNNNDPVSTPKKVVSQEKEIKFEIDTKPVMEYNDQEKIISEKLSKAVENHKNRASELNLKNIMGDFMVSEEEVFAENHFVANDMDVEQELELAPPVQDKPAKKARPIRATSYSALQDSLQARGFKFKPYEYEIKEEKQQTTFMLVNKLKLHLGLSLFLLNMIMVSLFVVVLNQVGYNFKAVDQVLVGISYGVGVLVMIGFALPYVWNAKKRKQNTFNLNQSILFGTLTFFALGIITYAVNSFVGFAPSNLADYIITLFLPLIVFLLFVIAPLVYHVLCNKKRYY